MDNDHIRFDIEKLQRDKIIYATESCAITLVCIAGMIATHFYIATPLKETIIWFLLVVCVFYTVYMGIGNFIRLATIKRDERKLENK